MNAKILKVITLVSYITMVLMNYLAVAIPIGGRDTGAISDSYPNLFTPAGYAFSIWGLIYTLLGVYVVFQFFAKKNELVTKVNRIFIVNSILNASWILAWHYDLIWLSVIIMFGLLYTLILIANLFKNTVFSLKEKWFVRLPFGVYFGWITIATIANIAVFLVYMKWNRFGISEVFWTVAVLLVGALIGSWRMLYDRFIPYGLVLIWAYAAILAKHLSVNGFDKQYPSIIGTTVFCILVFLVMIIFIKFKKNK